MMEPQRVDGDSPPCPRLLREDIYTRSLREGKKRQSQAGKKTAIISYLEKDRLRLAPLAAYGRAANPANNPP